MEKIVVIPDLHGQADLLQNVVDYYDEVGFAIDGDLLDGSIKIRQTIETAKNIGAAVTVGNHELVLEAALCDVDPERRQAWQAVWLGNGSNRRHYEDGTLDSYGLSRYSRRSDTAKAMFERLNELGHWDFLKQASFYIETDELLIIHGGLTKHQTWQTQRRQLETMAALRQANRYQTEPQQIFDLSFTLSTDWVRPKDLNKTLITGHTHSDITSVTDRAYPKYPAKASRVQLASDLKNGAPLFVYESWTGQVRAFPQD